MKKVLIFLTVAIMAITFIGCKNTTNSDDDETTPDLTDDTYIPAVFKGATWVSGSVSIEFYSIEGQNFLTITTPLKGQFGINVIKPYDAATGILGCGYFEELKIRVPVGNSFTIESSTVAEIEKGMIFTRK